MPPSIGLAARTAIGGDETNAKAGFAEKNSVSGGNLVHSARGCAHILNPALDQHVIIQPSRGGIADRQVGDGIGAFPSFLRGALIYAEQAQHVRPGALEPAQIVGVIDNARKIGVLEIGAHHEAVNRAIEQAARRCRK